MHMRIFDQAGRRVTDAVKGIQKKTNESMAIKRLESQIRQTQAEMDGIYKAIGEAVYGQRASDAPFAGLEELFEGVTQLRARIESISEQLDKLNDVRRCESCGKQAARAAKFCPHCGEKLPEDVPEPEEEAPAGADCESCGAPLEEGAKFCEQCGAEQKTQDEESEDTEDEDEEIDDSEDEEFEDEELEDEESEITDE
jgi:predicted RNA-binding Zn-ribbon protein involved in translation (DUF1610 family)